MPSELVDRPSDATGAIKRQPTMQRIEPVNGSRRLAHNTPETKKNGLIDFQPPEIDPLVINDKHIATGGEAFLARITARAERKQIREELQIYKDDPKNPRRQRLKKQLEQVEAIAQKATRFLDQWQHLDNNKYLQHLVDTNDELASRAQELLHFRLAMPGEFTPEQKLQMRAISEGLRDKLLARIREKGSRPQVESS